MSQELFASVARFGAACLVAALLVAGCSSDSATTAAGSSSGTPSVEQLLSVAVQRADLSAGSWATTQEARNVSASSGSGSEQACDGVAPADPHIRVVISGAHFEDASTGVAVSSVVQLYDAPDVLRSQLTAEADAKYFEDCVAQPYKRLIAPPLQYSNVDVARLPPSPGVPMAGSITQYSYHQSAQPPGVQTVMSCEDLARGAVAASICVLRSGASADDPLTPLARAVSGRLSALP